MLRTRLGFTAALVAIAALAAAAPSQAKTLLSTTVVSVPQTVERTCFARNVGSAAGATSRSVTSPGLGLVRARLTASRGNWDLGVFDAETGQTVASSAHYGAQELAEGLVQKGQRLIVQACRVSGPAGRALISVGFEALQKSRHPAQLVRVSTPTREAKEKLQSLGLDLTEHGGKDFLSVVVYSPEEAEKLGKAGFISVTEIRNLAAQSARDRHAEDVWASKHAVSSLPSGRTGPYRTLAEYSSEMNTLATANPSFVKKITLELNSWEGRPIEGLEITQNVNARDGKPVFLIMGLHHAREWPSGEHTLEWAYELINGYNASTARVVNLVNNVRTIVIPVVNPDGFNISRTVGGVDGANGRGGNENNNILLHPNEYRRKNCRIHPPELPAGSCAEPAFGVGSTGVDPNRNYGTFWGGPGSSADPINETFHGPHCANDEPVKGPNCGPFSEPETEAVRRLVIKRHVTTLITNHTFTGLVLRAPGLASQGLAPDEPAMKALGDAMAAQNGYVSQYGWQLYDTTGTTEDWSYNTTGGYGYTFEIGPSNFHPPYNQMIQEYDGSATWPNPDPLDGNREAYFLAMENTLDEAHHSVILGTAPAGAILRLKKVVQTPTSIEVSPTNRAKKTYEETLDTTMVVPGTGTYTWHINPSTRPIVMKDSGRISPPGSAPSPGTTFSGDITGAPDPCANVDTQDPACFNDHPFTVPPSVGTVDNGVVRVQINWPTPASDWDLRIIRDLDADGVSEPGEPVLAKSEQGTTSTEATSHSDPGDVVLPGAYVVRVINYQAVEPYNGTITFAGPEPFQPATTESWTLTCENPENTVLSTQSVLIARGDEKAYNFNAACALNPTGVKVSTFSVRRAKSAVELTWRSANESNLAGYNVWRGQKKLNRALIKAKKAGQIAGASYRFIDLTARRMSTYTYRLQAVTRAGARAWVHRATLRTQR